MYDILTAYKGETGGNPAAGLRVKNQSIARNIMTTTTQAKKHTFGSVRQEGQVRMDAVLEKHRVFFAFSRKQLDEGMLKINKTDDEKLADLGGGMFCPSSTVDNFILEFEAVSELNNKELIEKVGIEEMIIYELGNHESYYTGCTDSAADALEAYGITDRKLINKIYWQELPKHEDCY